MCRVYSKYSETRLIAKILTTGTLSFWSSRSLMIHFVYINITHTNPALPTLHFENTSISSLGIQYTCYLVLDIESPRNKHSGC